MTEVLFNIKTLIVVGGCFPAVPSIHGVRVTQPANKQVEGERNERTLRSTHTVLGWR